MPYLSWTSSEYITYMYIVSNTTNRNGSYNTHKPNRYHEDSSSASSSCTLLLLPPFCRFKSSAASFSSASTTSTSNGNVRMAAIPVNWFNSAYKTNQRHWKERKREERKGNLRCPDSCILENTTASPPLVCTASTNATYFFRVSGSLALLNKWTL